MNKVFSKYKRGDVWYVKFQNENGDGVNGSSVQRKSRPHVIVSCEENNNNAPVFQVIPIATMNQDHLPPHVYFDVNGRSQIVMCEQITTISILDLQREGSHFMYSFNLDFMNKIDDALAGQLGIRARVADMKVLQNLIDKIALDKELELKKKYEDSLQMRVEEIATSLSKRFGITLNSEDMITGKVYSNPDLKYAPKELRDKMNETAKERTNLTNKNENKSEGIPLPWDKSRTASTAISTPSNISNTNSNKKSSKRNKWTTEGMKQFLQDYETMSLQQVSEKYGVTKKSSPSLAWSFRKKLGITKD